MSKVVFVVLYVHEWCVHDCKIPLHPDVRVNDVFFTSPIGFVMYAYQSPSGMLIPSNFKIKLNYQDYTILLYADFSPFSGDAD